MSRDTTVRTVCVLCNYSLTCFVGILCTSIAHCSLSLSLSLSLALSHTHTIKQERISPLGPILIHPEAVTVVLQMVQGATGCSTFCE